jgi:hypothetical protein
VRFKTSRGEGPSGRTAAIPSIRPSPEVSGACLVLATASFVVGWILLAIAAPDMEQFFYQPRVLAVTHTFTLGWISLTIMGVLYQFVPALTKRPLRWPRAAAAQVALFAIGASGMVTHFWIGHLLGMAWSAGTVLISVLLLVALLLPPLLRAPRFDATVIGLIAALLCFAATAALGTLYAIDKVHPFLGGSVLSNIAAHAHLALLGWITLTICAVSYRMIAAFVLPESLLPHAARRQIVLLASLVPVLVAALLLRYALVTMLVAAAVAAAMAWYAAIILRLLHTRRLPLDWSLAHVLAALAHLAAAVACALLLLVAVDPGSAAGNRLVLAYGVFALIGWISNFIVGMGTRMTSGLLGRGSRPLLPPIAGGILFLLLNVGVIAVVAGTLAGSVVTIRVASWLPLSAALLFAGALLRRLRSAAPTRAEAWRFAR